MQDNSGVLRVLRVEVEETDALCALPARPEEWFDILEDARDEGYNTVAVVLSGALEGAAKAVLAATDPLGLGSSVTGDPETIVALTSDPAVRAQHWIVRLNRPTERAADSAKLTRLLHALRGLTARTASVSLVLHLDQTNLDDLPWAAWLAAEQQVTQLTVETTVVHRPADPRNLHTQLDFSQRVWAMMVLARARQRYPKVRYEIDLSDVNLVRSEPKRLLAETTTTLQTQPLADLVSPLVIDASGKVSPLLSSLSPKLMLGHLEGTSLAALARAWKADTSPAFRRFCRQVHADVCENTVLPFFNWADHLRLQSRRIDAIVPRLPAPQRPVTVAANANLSWSPLQPRVSRVPELPWEGPLAERVVDPGGALSQRAAVTGASRS